MNRNRVTPTQGRPLLEPLEPRLLLDADAGQQALELFSVSPALFVENQGQWADPAVRYVHQGSGANVAMTDAGPVFQIFRQAPREGGGAGPENDLAGPPGGRFGPDLSQTQVLQFSSTFVGAAAVSPVGLERSQAAFNYFVGDQANWRSEVPAYEKVAYGNLYDGIDLVTWGQRDSLKYEFHVAPGADWRQIQVRYKGIEGLSIADDGSLRLALAEGWGEVVDDAPAIYQVIDGQKVSVGGGFRLIDSATYAFALADAYDPSAELVIDPDLAWFTYLGGSSWDEGYAIAVDASGNAYVAGYTSSMDFSGRNNNYKGGWDAFVAKVNSTGSTLLYCTYVGGSGIDRAHGIAVDSVGNAYVTGETTSSQLATVGAYDTTYNGGLDVFVAKVNASGSSLVYATYLGGAYDEGGCGISVDSAGNAYVTGYTFSPGRATAGAYDTTYEGGRDVFVAKVSATGSSLLYSTYLGGSGEDVGYAIAVDGAGNAYVTGSTSSSGWATPGAYNTAHNGGLDVFVAKVSGTGSSLLYATFLGGTPDDWGYSIAVDSAGNAYVTGLTASFGWATAGAYGTTYRGGTDVFVAKLSATGSSLLYATYLGGSNWDGGHSIAVDSAGNAYVTGGTYSSGWATTGAYDTTYKGDGDVFVAKVSGTGSSLLYSTYLGGIGEEAGYGIAVDGTGNVYVTGSTSSSGWATPAAYDTSWNGSYDVFVAKFSGLAEPADAGDALSCSADLGTVAGGSSISRGDQIGNGSFGAKDVDLYKFILSSGGTVTLDVDAQSIGSGLDAYLRLFNASGQELGANDDHDGLDAWVEAELPAGTYYVGVSGYANMRYEPLVAGSGAVSGSTGPYRLKLTFTPGDLLAPPHGGGEPVASLELSGDFEDGIVNGRAVKRRQGVTLINDLLRIEGLVWYDTSLNIGGAGKIWMDDVPVLGDVLLFEGEFFFAAGEVFVDGLNDALSGLRVAGLDVYLDKFTLISNGVRLEGALALPDELGGIRVDFADPHYIDLTTEGIVYDFVVSANDVLLDLSGIGLYALDAELEVSNADGTADAVLTGTFGLLGLFEGMEVDLSKAEGNYFAFGESGWDLNGTLTVGRFDFIPGVLYVEDLFLDVDTATATYYGEGWAHLPFGDGVDVFGQFGIVQGYLDTVGLVVQDLDEIIWPTPPVLLDTVSGSVQYLTPDEIDGKPTFITVEAALQVGPDIGDFCLLYLDLEVKLDLGGGVQGTAVVLVGNPDDPIAQGSVTIVWVRDRGFGLAGDLTVGDPADPVLILDGAMLLDTANNFQGSLNGVARIPHSVPLIGWAFGGQSIPVRSYAQATDNSDPSDDYVIAGAELPMPWPWPNPLRYAIEVNLNNGAIIWGASWDRIRQVVIPSLDQTGAGLMGRGLALAAEEEAFTVDPGTPWVIFRAGWETGDGDLELVAPDGTTVINPSNVDTFPDIGYYKNLNVPEAFYVIKAPTPGSWTLRVPDTTGMGEIVLEQLGETSAPEMSLLGPQFDMAGGPVTITWVDEDTDSMISLYYDTDRQGADGVLIASGISQDNDPDSYVWDTSGVPTGEYYVYAVIDDGDNVPAVSYSTGRVRAVRPDAPPQVTGLNAPEGTDTSARLTWEASPALDLAHYLVRITADAAGEFYEQSVAAVGTETIIDGLVQGETYRVAVAAVDVEGRVGPDSSPVIVVVGGTASVPPAAGQWDVFARPGTLYQAQVPGSAGDVFALVDAPAGATLSADGLFQWNVPADADGWRHVLVHVTLSDGSKNVCRYKLLSDSTVPAFATGAVQVAAVDASTLTITAPAGLDVSGVLLYRLERNGTVAGNWQTSPAFTDTGLQPNTAYGYRVEVEDSSPDRRTAWSGAISGRTLAAVPQAPVLGTSTSTTALLAGLASDANPAGTLYAIRNATTGKYVAADGTASETPVWLAATSWVNRTVVGLTPDTDYRFQVMARNADGVETALGPAAVTRTARETASPTVLSRQVVQTTGDVSLEFSEPVLCSVKDVVVTDSAQNTVSLATATFAHTPGSSQATLKFNELLQDGTYTLLLKGTSVQDLSANLLDGNGDGMGGDDFTLGFTVATRPPVVVAVRLNSAAARGISGVDPSGAGVRKIEVTFSKMVNFAAEDVVVQKVTFLNGQEQPGETLMPLSVMGSGTNTVTIGLANAAAIDTWVRVTVKSDHLADRLGRLLDGDVPVAGSGRNYLFDTTEDLPTGDGNPGGDAVFYVGSLRGDFSGDLAITAADKDGFAAAWRSGSLDADFRGVGFGPRPPDGRITLADINGFTSVYQAGIALGRHLDPLPMSGGGLASEVTPLPPLTAPSAGTDILTEAAGLLPLSQQTAPPVTGPQDTHLVQGDEDPLDLLRLRRLRPVAVIQSAGAAVLRV